eukprot:CAMPEP_0181233376 /NCGR_PEP_ID=MMETSP1096-20121128/36298_1 /TAXON_ID=156174 ORGANISM="Chrysochromulina ericina, Strain CCMP281" /NCGR_SAMPLE_ID=MMETSP1096 /ASSEMBLY_ACC=CAM_ASM_000453 /LENGTH=59 /DNA_ID=CAMNT_0023327863 /DNA_START=48 /DNA_END=227 /DNA_ORIENTATION=-
MGMDASTGMDTDTGIPPELSPPGLSDPCHSGPCLSDHYLSGPWSAVDAGGRRRGGEGWC